MLTALQRGYPTDRSLAEAVNASWGRAKWHGSQSESLRPSSIFAFSIAGPRAFGVATLISAVAQMVLDWKTSDFYISVLDEALLGDVLFVGGVWRANRRFLYVYHVN
jgi:hypothetical protein